MNPWRSARRNAVEHGERRLARSDAQLRQDLESDVVDEDVDNEPAWPHCAGDGKLL